MLACHTRDADEGIEKREPGLEDSRT